jgi:hypothetical protein
MSPSRGRIAVLLTALPALATAQGAELDWALEPGGAAVAVDGRGEVYTARWDQAPGAALQVARRGRDGQLRWERSTGQPAPDRHEVAQALAVDSQGRAVVAGTLRAGSQQNPVNVHGFVAQLGPKGTLRWRQELSQAFDGSRTRRLLVGPQDQVSVLGLGAGPAGLVAQVTRLDADGVRLWQWSDPQGLGAPEQLKPAADGGLLITLRAATANAVVRLDAQGQALWTWRGTQTLVGGDAALDANGHAYVVDAGQALHRLAPDGTPLWSVPTGLTAVRVAVGPDGLPVVAGTPAQGFGAAFAKFDADGGLLWQQLDGDGPATALLTPGALAIDPHGAAYLPGTTLSSMGVAKVRADGSAAWVGLAPGGTPLGMALGPDLSVHLVGGVTARFSQVLADLQLALKAPASARVGQPVVTQLRLRQAGPRDSPQATLDYRVPADWRLDTAQPSQGSCQAEGRQLRCTLGPMAAGQRATVDLQLTPLASGRRVQRASATGPLEDPAPTDNQARGATTVQP